MNTCCSLPRRGTTLLLGLLAGNVGCMDYLLNRMGDSVSTPVEDQGDPSGSDDDYGLPCWEGDEIPQQVAIDESCHLAGDAGSLDFRVEWAMEQFDPYPEYSDVLMTPVVGQLTDDNGDGVIGSGDIPDIVVVADYTDGQSDNGVLRVISGDGSQIHTTLQSFVADDGHTYHMNHYTNVALGDIDADGLPEIVLTVVDRGEERHDTGTGPVIDTSPPDSGGSPADTGGGYTSPPPPRGGVAPPGNQSDNCAIAALRPDGGLEWLSSEARVSCAGHAPALADLEGDGTVEVVLGSYILSGADGGIRAHGGGGNGGYVAYDEVGYLSFPLDLDGDGQQEIIAGNTIYDSQGETVCKMDSWLEDGFPAAADLDGDGAGEFVVVGNGRLHVHQADCTLIASWDLDGGGNGGPPTIADFDGDGSPEIGVAGSQYYSVYEYTGEKLWSAPITDESSHATGSSVFDFDGDGQSEVVYADETRLWIFDGATGDVRLEWDGHSSRTLHEYPTIVDVDADGMTEIVVPNGGGHYDARYRGLSVLGSEFGDWMSNRQVWNQHAYNIVNINDDLSLPRHPESNWPGYNNFRSGFVDVPEGMELPDVVPTVTALCRYKCTQGRLELLVGLGNGGTEPIAAGVPVSVYAESAGETVFLQTLYSAESLEQGTTASLFFQLDASSVPEGVVIVSVDDAQGAGILDECNEGNNRIRVAGVTCY